MRLSAFQGHYRFLSVAVLGAMLAFPANAETNSQSKTPSTDTQTQSAGTSGAEAPSKSPESTPAPSTATKPEASGASASSSSPTPEAKKPVAAKPPRKAAIVIVVNKPAQVMTVTVQGKLRYRWPVSTGATRYSTPDGSYTPFRMEVMHYSREWDNAGMPHAIFFTQRGHSIHGSDHPGLGTNVSHGCVRLTLTNAATLYQLVQSVGMGNAKVVISGADPPGYRVPTMPPQQRPVGLFGGFFR
jgi:lipoprotein-anchoring transpeptidase ErfK/SrfK